MEAVKNVVDFETRTTLEDAGEKLRKARYLLGEVIHDYGYYESPSYAAIKDWFDGVKYDKENETHQKQSVDWLIDYERVINPVDIAKDLIDDAMEMIAQAGVK